MPVKTEDKRNPSRHLLRDLAIHSVKRDLRPVFRLNETQTVQRNGRDVVWDFEPRAGRENLAQAVILRLLTQRGELSALGHVDYGSRVPELIGRENNDTTRNQLKLFMLEALKQEPRIEKVTALTVKPSPGTRQTVDVWLEVKPVAFAEPIEIGPFTIDLGA